MYGAPEGGALQVLKVLAQRDAVFLAARPSHPSQGNWRGLRLPASLRLSRLNLPFLVCGPPPHSCPGATLSARKRTPLQVRILSRESESPRSCRRRSSPSTEEYRRRPDFRSLPRQLGLRRDLYCADSGSGRGVGPSTFPSIVNS